MNDADQQLRPWVPQLAELMDSRFRLPGTDVRFGLDPIIGLIPVLGDTITFIIGSAMLGEAWRLGLGPGTMGKMLGNLFLDWLVGLVPGLDLITDTLVKAHNKNAQLLQHEVSKRNASKPAATRVAVSQSPTP